MVKIIKNLAAGVGEVFVVMPIVPSYSRKARGGFRTDANRLKADLCKSTRSFSKKIMEKGC